MLEVAKRRVAQLGRDIDPQAAQQLKDQSYIDNTVMGGSQEDIKQMCGK